MAQILAKLLLSWSSLAARSQGRRSTLDQCGQQDQPITVAYVFQGALFDGERVEHLDRVFEPVALGLGAHCVSNYLKNCSRQTLIEALYSWSLYVAEGLLFHDVC